MAPHIFFFFLITLGLVDLIVTSPSSVSSNLEILSNCGADTSGSLTFLLYSALVGLNDGEKTFSSSSLLDDILHALLTRVRFGPDSQLVSRRTALGASRSTYRMGNSSGETTAKTTENAERLGYGRRYRKTAAKRYAIIAQNNNSVIGLITTRGWSDKKQLYHGWRRCTGGEIYTPPRAVKILLSGARAGVSGRGRHHFTVGTCGLLNKNVFLFFAGTQNVLERKMETYVRAPTMTAVDVHGPKDLR